MHQPVSPPSLGDPAAAYSHAVLTQGATRLLHTAGVVASTADGTVPESLEEQAALVWANLAAILQEAGMQVTDVVSITTYVVVGGDLGVVMAARDRAMAGHRPASTLLLVPALARPAWKLEISLVAAA